MIRITYADGTTRECELSEVMFGDEETAAHGPVRSVTPAARVDRSPDGAFPNHTRLSRSVTRREAA